MNTIIQLKSLKITYPRSSQPIITIPEWEVKQGEFWIILGANGSGKTTILYALTGIIPILINAEVDGEISIVRTNPANTFEIFKKVALLLQNPYDQLTQSTVENEIIFPLSNIGVEKKRIESALSRFLTFFQIQDLKGRNPQTLSSGEAQKVLLASMCSRNPELFLFDEPEAHLDYEGQLQLLQTIKTILERKKTIVITSHSPEKYVHLNPKFLFITKRNALLFGSITELFQKANWEEIEKLSYAFQKNFIEFSKNPENWEWKDYTINLVDKLCP